MNVEKNNILCKDYGKIKLAQYLYGNYPPECREKLFRITHEYLAGVAREDVMVDAILIQPNEKLKAEWSKELEGWDEGGEIGNV